MAENAGIIIISMTAPSIITIGTNNLVPASSLSFLTDCIRSAEAFGGWTETPDGAAEPVPSEEAPAEPAAPALPLERVCVGAAAVRSFERSYKNLHEKILRRLTTRLAFHGRVEEPDRWDYSDYIYIFGGENAAELKRSVKFITEDHPLPKRPETAEKTEK